MRAILAGAVVLALAPAAVAALPVKGATYKGQTTATTLTMARDGRTISALRLAPARQPAACKLKNPVLKGLKITAAGKLTYRATVPNAAGKKIGLILKVEFYTDYLAEVTATYSGAGCRFAFSDTLNKR